MRLLLLLVIPMTITILVIPHVEAADYYKGKAVDIELSKTCKVSSKCPKPVELVPFDNSTKRFFGGFDAAGNRIMSPRTDAYMWLRTTDAFTVFYDAPPKTKQAIPVITIAPSLPAYFTAEQMKKVEVDNGPYKATETIRQISHTRFVNDSCTQATITAENWKQVLPDTIRYMHYGCDPAYTNIDTITDDIQKITEHKIPESYKYKLDKMYDQVKKSCLKTYGKCTPVNPNIVDEDQPLPK